MDDGTFAYHVRATAESGVVMEYLKTNTGNEGESSSSDDISNEDIGESHETAESSLQSKSGGGWDADGWSTETTETTPENDAVGSIEAEVMLVSLGVAVEEYNTSIRERRQEEIAASLVKEENISGDTEKQDIASESSGSSVTTATMPDLTPPPTEVAATTATGSTATASLREWAAVNRKLASQGFAQVEVDASATTASEMTAHPRCCDRSARTALREVLDQYARRGRRIEDLSSRCGGAQGHMATRPPPFTMGGSHDLSSGDGLLHQPATTAALASAQADASTYDERLAERLRRKVASLENELEQAQAEALAVRRSAKDEAKRAEQALKDVKLQLKQSEHRVRRQEQTCERLVEKLRVQVDLEKEQRERDRKAFLRLQRRPPNMGASSAGYGGSGGGNSGSRGGRVGRSSDARLLELVSAYERQRADSADELASMQRELRRLNENLREKENTILRHGYGFAAGPGPVGSNGDLAIDLSSASLGGLDMTGLPLSSIGAAGDNTTSSSFCGGGPAGSGGGGGGGGGLSGFDPSLATSSSSSSSSTAFNAVAVQQLGDKYREQGRALHVATVNQSKLEAQVQTLAGQAASSNELVQEQEELVGNLKLELASRPSLKQWRSLKHECSELGRQLVAADARARDASDLKELRRHMSTKALVELDKDNQRLKLQNIEALPREFTKEVLMGACRALGVSDVGLIVPSVHKLASAVALLPRLESFARSVCQLITPTTASASSASKDHHGPKEDGDDVVGAVAGRDGGGGGVAVGHSVVMEDCLPVLAQWKRAMQHTSRLEVLRSQVETLLRKRKHMPPHVRGGGGEVEEGEGLATMLEDGEVVEMVQGLVMLESQLLARTKSYEAAEAALELNPDLVNNRIVLHFQYLFQVKRLEGVFPKMNELYVFVSEVQSVLRALRSVCRLPVHASPKAVLSAVEHLLVTHTGSSGGGNVPRPPPQRAASNQPPPRPQMRPPPPQTAEAPDPFYTYQG